MALLDHKDSFVLDWLLSGAIEKNGDKGDVHEEASCVDQTGGLESKAATHTSRPWALGTMRCARSEGPGGARGVRGPGGG